MLTISEIQTHPKFQDQLALEEEMRAMGIAQHRSAVEKAEKEGQATRAGAARRMVTGLHQTVLAGIEAFIEASKSGGPGRRHSALKLVEEVKDNDLLAHVTIRHCVDGIVHRRPLQTSAISLSSHIEDEMHFRAWKKADKFGYEAQQKKMATKTNDKYRRKSSRITAAHKGVENFGWSDTEKVQLGVKLIEIMAETTGLVRQVRDTTQGKTTPVLLEATEQALEWLATENSRIEWLAPKYMPCVVPPKPWTTPFDGGYWSGRVRRLTLVKTRNRQYLEALRSVPMPQVYDAVNALQNTPWSINQRVFEVMKHLWDRGLSMGVIPEVENIPIPNKPGWLTEEVTAETMSEEQKEEFRAWKNAAREVHETNAALVCERLSFSLMLSTATRFENEEEFFYPYQLDFRGRVYPVGLYLHPQGNDAQRGLLEFANVCPVGSEEGALWLAVHGAGLWGVDKVSLEARRQWVIDNQDKILASAVDPLENRFWADAEKPWQALAFCFDWAGFIEEGYDHLSSLPVQMDGTCNGLQQFSAILRDPIGGAAVNLVPADKPQDIYQRVADIVSKVVERDAVCDDPELSRIASGWVGRVTRKVTKRPVMTLAYGAKQFGFRTQVFDDTVKAMKLEMGGNFPWNGSGWEGASYLGGVIWDAVGEVVVAARAAMDWLQEASRVASAEGLPVNWTTPDGFPVQQAYRASSAKRIELMFQSVRLQLSIRKEEEKIDGRKQASSISPNWVHSLDAAHMRKTINACHAMGIRSFGMIHDSYGTHAGNAPILASLLREEFVKMYTEQDVLATFAEELRAQVTTPDEIPPLPPKGSLDLQLVLESPFFFA